VWQAAHDTGALEPIQRLQGGFDALLGKWFGGAELSGGEWQRIALARAFFRRASLVVLDEPTSAMDSWAEQDWLGRFRTLTEGRTALMITHRFPTAMYADVIHVLDRGRVVESGTHAQLVAQGGAYARSWAAQMQEIGHAPI
jgi:ATP-binding cassette subfamily B protein